MPVFEQERIVPPSDLSSEEQRLTNVARGMCARYGVAMSRLFDNLVSWASTPPGESADLAEACRGLLGALEEETAGEPELTEALLSPVIAEVHRLRRALLDGRRGAALAGCFTTLDRATRQAARACAFVGNPVPGLTWPVDSGLPAGRAQALPSDQSDPEFGTLNEFVQALTAAVGCNNREDGIGGLYTKQGLRCRSDSGTGLVAMFAMSASDSDRFIAHHLEHRIGTRDPLLLVRGRNWLVNTLDADVAHDVQQALGGRIVAPHRDEVDAAADAEAAEEHARYLARLPRPQRPHLAPQDYPPKPADQTQALLVHWGPPPDDDALAASDLDEAFIEAIESAGAGVGDGDEHGPEGVVFYYYGPDAEAMLIEIRPVLAQLPVPPGSFVTLRHDGQLLRSEDLPAKSG